MSIPAFISYSHQDRRLAALLKASLDYYDFETFLAHEDLQPSEEWQKVIFARLKDCSVFLPLLTDAFAKSDWTDQETGIAVALNKIIVPVKVSLNPYGFIGRYQALTLKPEKDGKVYPTEVEEACWSIVKKLGANRKLSGDIKDGIIKVFAGSGSFNEAARNATRLRSFEPFTDEQLNEIVDRSGMNSQIYGGWEARAYVKDLIEREKSRIDRTLVSRFRQMTNE